MLGQSVQRGRPDSSNTISLGRPPTIHTCSQRKSGSPLFQSGVNGVKWVYLKGTIPHYRSQRCHIPSKSGKRIASLGSLHTPL
ncbi:hypothetical protein E2C01_035322 [Portunus trituberculatus]|uniref:Uncharacterized protein n=1 Tax=Portunus trituberculatus TaxID=210409 RepID=A0A5B7F3X3_PORTR|nr:hypothetical protein [Portunus trituberculatus]